MSSTLTWRPTTEADIEANSRYHNIDGPQINALQMVSEALDIPQQDDMPEDENSQFDVVDEGGRSQPPSTPFTFGNRTIVAADNEVSNGFVKSGTGKSLPYVFEANESGMRKRSSKILPVCAVCGKRFVCVTTMKRHLVTHTGEKPFSCKVCGKQYTQKGNLRVHERTHRNDRPFECNICHQKFYRKEPMQKHQWRQHGIVHFKSRPTPESTPAPNPIAAVAPTPAPRNPVKLEPPRPLISVRPAAPTSYTALVDSMKARREREESPYSRSVLDQGNPPLEPPIAHQQNHHLDVPKYCSKVEPIEMTVVKQPVVEIHHHHREVASATAVAPNPATPVKDQTFSYSSMLNDQPTQQPNSHLLIIHTTEPTATVTTATQSTPTEPAITAGGEPGNTQQLQQNNVHPLKLKMKMAYQREQQVEQQQVEQNKQNEIKALDNELNEMKIQQNTNSNANTETVDCQCKTCGNIFSVVDPYNFKCNNCHVKYTSLPTHLIADPLQCIGCCAVFPHKPALKAHQMVPDKERPFRCCKCGYGFRQKAHLQKHQWRIHRRKLEPDPNVKEAEAFFEVIQRARDQSSERATITMQDIINKSVEKSIDGNPQNLMKTSSKYYSEVLGLEYDPKNNGSATGSTSTTTSEEDDSRDQPLDLSPAKKQYQTLLEIPSSSQKNSANTNVIISKPSSLIIMPFQPSAAESQQQKTNNNNSNNLSTSKISARGGETSTTSASGLLTHQSETTEIASDYPAWKKQKTNNPSSSSLTITATHATLPPISGLQKPMSLVTMKNNYKHSSWITEGHNQEAAVQNLHNMQAKHPENNNSMVRSQLELLRSTNARTV